MSVPDESRSSPLSTDDNALLLEQSYWETYEDYDWSSDEAKEQAIACIPKLTGDILELCIGGGAFAAKIPDGYDSYTGLDLSKTLLKALECHLPHVKGIHGDAQNLAFDDESFDCIILFSGLHHLPQHEKTISGAFRILRPGGCFFCFEPNDRAWFRVPMRFLRKRKFVRDFIEIYSEDEVYLDPAEVAAVMGRAGFADIRTNYMTPRFNPDFLGFVNRIFARMMYTAGALGDSVNTQSYFALSGVKPTA